ncbi:SWIM zinc finger family protein [Metabacillus arenae]|uniref:SWIM zinc finger family protein n=1 Tax=Metabacillus arenae TaxID=2771434 RepID=A0A926NRG7_9BACI|nr:SWIM zinc finger family protein [Metabacillus arenae]MBD1382632.1 SWIM zinc finger family protein [Metabacillus arenae]
MSEMLPSKEQVLHASDQMMNLLSPSNEQDRNLIKKGLILYRQGSVSQVRSQDDLVKARVQDVSPVNVELDLNFVSMSTCTCPADELCRHITAVFLYVYAHKERLGTFVDQWKSAPKPDQVIKTFSPQKQANSHKKDEPKQESIASWYEFFEREFQSWQANTGYSSVQLAQSLHHTFYAGIKRKTPMKPEVKRLYLIHAANAAIEKLLLLIEQTNPNEYLLQQIYFPYMDQLQDDLYYELQELKRYALPFSMDPLLEDSPEKFHGLLIGGKAFQYDRISIYRMIWSSLFRKEKWIDQEREWLEKRKQHEMNQDNKFLAECEVALMHLHFLQKKDDLVIERSLKLTEALFPFTLNWIEELADKKEWNRLNTWLSYIEKAAPAYLENDLPFDEKRMPVRFLLRVLTNYCQETKKEEQFERYCEMLLPYSYAEFQTFLFVQGRYEKWLELQSLIGFGVYELDRDYLKEIEKQAPKTLLPFYHEAVRDEIEQKSRQHYKLAVRYLKKLRTLYKKMKKEDVWEHYLMKLMEEHKRLRAFHEELKKGKLVHD